MLSVVVLLSLADAAFQYTSGGASKTDPQEQLAASCLFLLLIKQIIMRNTELIVKPRKQLQSHDTKENGQAHFDDVPYLF